MLIFTSNFTREVLNAVFRFLLSAITRLANGWERGIGLGLAEKQTNKKAFRARVLVP